MPLRRVAQGGQDIGIALHGASLMIKIQSSQTAQFFAATCPAGTAVQ
jgi:hypothetical protein